MSQKASKYHSGQTAFFEIPEMQTTNLSLKSQKREIIELGRSVYEPIKNIIFLDDKQEIEYISDNAYLAKIMEYMNGR